MAVEVFIPKTFRPKSLRIIEQANAIASEYEDQGYSLTLRQLYYQFVARDLLPNTQSDYKRLGAILNDARLAGLFDWDMMEDITRYLRQLPSWESPRAAIRALIDQYRENPWRFQEYQPEVWVEKDALLGIVAPACERWRVPHFACRGYCSQSELYAAGKRMAAAMDAGKVPVVFHLGDHDPSGIDMTRDNFDRLSMFAGFNVEFHRLALNSDQIAKYNPPPNPAKDSDTRFADYVKAHGAKCWELDALSPTVIGALIDSAIETVCDKTKWQEAKSREGRSLDSMAGLQIIYSE